MSHAFAALPLVVVPTLSDGGTAHAGGHNSHTGTTPPTGHVTLGRRPGARQWIKGLCIPSVGKPAKCMDIPHVLWTQLNLGYEDSLVGEITIDSDIVGAK